jgi:hypothetical protein
MGHKPFGPLQASADFPQEMTSSSRETLTLVRKGTTQRPEKGRKLVDALDNHLAESDDYVLEGSEEYPCKVPPPEAVLPRIRGQDYNQGLASWLRSNCALKTRDDRVRPIVWLRDAEDYKGRRKRSQDMKGRVAVFKKPSDLPPHWNPKSENRTEGFEDLIRPPTLRQVLAKGLVEMYDRGDRLKPLPHIFKTRVQLMIEPSFEDQWNMSIESQDSEAFCGPPEYTATVDNNDVIQVSFAHKEQERYRNWFRNRHDKSSPFLKALDQPFLDVIHGINQNNPTRVLCNQVKGYVDWLRSHEENHVKVEQCLSQRLEKLDILHEKVKEDLTENKRLDQWLKRMAIHGRTCLDEQELLKKKRMWKCAVKRYMNGKGTARQLTALSKVLFDDGRQHIELAPPSGHVLKGDRLFYHKCVEQYLRGKISPHRIMRLYKHLFPNGLDSKGWGCNIIPIGKPITRYQHSFYSERLLQKNREMFRRQARTIACLPTPESHRSTDEASVMTEDEARLSHLISSQYHAMQKMMSVVHDKFEEIADRLSMELLLSMDTATDMIVEKLSKERKPSKKVSGYEIDPTTGIYRPES